jgi:hypothetical protein
MQACCGVRDLKNPERVKDMIHIIVAGKPAAKKSGHRSIIHFYLCRMKKTDQPSLIHPVAR